MIELLLFILVVVPVLSAACCYSIRISVFRSIAVLMTCGLLALSAVLLIPHMPFEYTTRYLFNFKIHEVIRAADFLLLFVILYFGIKHRHLLINILAVFQMVLLGYLEIQLSRADTVIPLIYCDHLSLIMVLIVSIVGSIICCQAIPYMRNHEHHLNLGISRQPRFFAVMILFLGAMNGLCLTNDLVMFYFFFELTTLCSFLLIGHDQTEIAVKNALRALWMNSLGGAAFIAALVGLYHQVGTMSLLHIIHETPQVGLIIMPLALLCFAGFTKSAQFPFQGWLLGAMVAPTPVSALLHSSTMVKIGVYLVLRLAPAFAGAFLSQAVALCGAFTFLSAAALAVGQSNGKKVLAYSTISNLGLIFACAGINTQAAFSAAILLIIFHAVTKALLFLCVGTIEQHIASRDIEDMRGLYAVMPVTALITVVGVITMIMPPFGVLLGKWMAMEAAAANLYLIVMIALGSALTVMYWARWAGTLMSDRFAGRFKMETQPLLTWGALLPLCGGAVVLSIAAPWIYDWLINPLVMDDGFLPAYRIRFGILENAVGAFDVVPLGIVAIFGFSVSLLALVFASRGRIVSPYLSGAQTDEPGMFNGPMNQPVKAEAKNYYLGTIFGEDRLTTWINLGALVLLTLTIGGAL